MSRDAAPDALDILLVDDEPEMRGVLEEQLVDLGHRVTTARDGAEGSGRVRRRQGFADEWFLLVLAAAHLLSERKQVIDLLHRQIGDLQKVAVWLF